MPLLNSAKSYGQYNILISFSFVESRFDVLLYWFLITKERMRYKGIAKLYTDFNMAISQIMIGSKCSEKIKREC